MERYRQIIYFKNYFFDFFEQQTEKVKEKIDYVLFVVTVANRIPQKFFQHLEGTNGLYEIRVEFQGNIYRIFCCFDDGITTRSSSISREASFKNELTDFGFIGRIGRAL